MLNRKAKITTPRFVIAVLASTVAAFTVRADVISVSETTLLAFSGANGNQPSGALIQAADQNFYGTTLLGGTNNFGTVFQITSAGSLTTLYSFAGTTDGSHPSASLIQTSSGAFYGTTNDGGGDDDGTLFQITPSGSLKTLYAFTGGNDGSHPLGGLILASDGNYYGTTSDGGANGAGTVFELPSAGGSPVTLYSFTGETDASDDGAYPEAGLVQASDGNLYGTTFSGGGRNCGTLFELTLPTVGAPTGVYSTLYSFTCSIGTQGGGSGDEGAPLAALVQGPDGSDGTHYLYGATSGNGLDAAGTVFQVAINGPAAGTLTTLHTFAGGTTDGSSPQAALLLGSDGNLYGTTAGGGTNGDGTVFWVSTDGQKYSSLYSFAGADGSDPLDGLVEGSDGSLYGVTSVGGSNSEGGVFRMIPTPALAPPLAFSINHPAIYLGQSAILTWSALNAQSGGSDSQCFGTGSWSGPLGSSGSQSVTPSAAGSYTYRLTCGGVESGFVTLTVNPLDNPTGGTAQFGDGSVTLSWTPVANEGVTSYQVIEGNCNNVGSPVATTSGSSVLVTDATGNVPLQDGTTYYFKVISANSAGVSTCSTAPAIASTPMQAPTGLSATAGDSQVTLNWTRANGASSYNVYSVNGAQLVEVTQNISCSYTVTNGSCTITGLVNGTQYAFTVAAVTPNGGSPEQAFCATDVTATPLATPPGAPANLTATPGNAQVMLTFSPVAGAAGYDVYEQDSSTSKTFSKVTSGITFVNNLDGTVSATITGLINGSTYYFLVDAVNGNGAEGPQSNAVGATPEGPEAAPAALTAIAKNNEVDLSWDSVSGASSYDLYQGTTSGGEVLVASNIQSTSYSVLGLTNGTPYYFEVAAVNEAGPGALSQEVSAAPIPPPAAPTGLTASVGSGEVALRWNAVAGAASYTVYKTSGSVTSAIAVGLTQTAYTATGLKNGVGYSFEVSAVNSAGASNAAAAEVTAMPEAGKSGGAFSPELLAVFGLAALRRRMRAVQARSLRHGFSRESI